MTNPYIDGDTLRECEEGLRNGRTIEQLAGMLRCDADHLAKLMGRPRIHAVPEISDACSDLFSIDQP